MFKKENENGQSILIIAMIVLVLLALVALVVDVGNAYAHRRMVQNAVDAAAMAGARKLAFRGPSSTNPAEEVSHSDVAAYINWYAEENGLQQANLRAWFILDNGKRVQIEASDMMAPEKAVGVGVEADLPFDTYFAHLLGFDTMEATADSAAYHIWGPCSIDDCIFPVIVDNGLFVNEPGGKPVIGKEYVLWVHSQLTPGNFGWIYWVDGEGNLRGDPPQGPEVTSLEPNLIDNCRSGGWQAGEWVHGDNGVNFQPVLDILEQRINNELPMTVTVPIYDGLDYQGNNSIFRISGFGVFNLICAHSSRAHYAGDCGPEASKDNTKYLTGRFVREHIPEGFEDGCVDTGVTGVSMRPPKNLWMPEWTEDDDD